MPRGKRGTGFKKPPSRPVRWADAVSKAMTAIETIRAKHEEFDVKANALIEEMQSKLEDELNQMEEDFQSETADAQGDLADALEELKSVQEEYNEWYENMPESLQNGPTGEKLQEIGNRDFETEFELSVNKNIELSFDIETNLDEIEGVIQEAEGTEMPMGFGRD